MRHLLHLPNQSQSSLIKMVMLLTLLTTSMQKVNATQTAVENAAEATSVKAVRSVNEVSATSKAGLLDPSRFVLGIKYTGLTYHPGGGENIEPYPRSLDDKDYWVVLVGVQTDMDYITNKYFYLRASTSIYRDCSDLWAGLFHFGFRANWDITPKLSTRIGIGPTFLWRQNWYGKVKGYSKDSFFGDATPGTFQNAFVWYGGDLDVEWKLSNRLSLLYSVIPGYPEVIQNSLGMRIHF